MYLASYGPLYAGGKCPLNPLTQNFDVLSFSVHYPQHRRQKRKQKTDPNEGSLNEYNPACRCPPTSNDRPTDYPIVIVAQHVSAVASRVVTGGDATLESTGGKTTETTGRNYRNGGVAVVDKLELRQLNDNEDGGAVNSETEERGTVDTLRSVFQRALVRPLGVLLGSKEKSWRGIGLDEHKSKTVDKKISDTNWDGKPRHSSSKRLNDGLRLDKPEKGSEWGVLPDGVLLPRGMVVVSDREILGLEKVYESEVEVYY
ncbi:hypothetical protein B0T20DRAFT_500886 [Sordaria brevicollis]|uniref:Uncharacterized protein n=1 Tax=Sordaria brevicollis TaxID=83679 RepID=A0AAE0PC61_SORBR|nr:hypothetical protein B0T20DRAFT_500886 [Sordaria brevicollis]